MGRMVKTMRPISFLHQANAQAKYDCIIGHMNIQDLTKAERSALAAKTGISIHTLNAFAAPTDSGMHRWPSAMAAQAIEEADPRFKCGELCPACATCPYFNK